MPWKNRPVGLLATGGDKRRKLKNKRDYKNKSQNTD
jgi:hypothetical protein